MTIGEGSVALRTTIRRLLGEGKNKILLNLGGVGYIDSSGIGELVSSFTAVKKEGGVLKLLSLTQKIQDLLALCGDIVFLTPKEYLYPHMQIIAFTQLPVNNYVFQS